VNQVPCCQPVRQVFLRGLKTLIFNKRRFSRCASEKASAGDRRVFHGSSLTAIDSAESVLSAV